jgi:DNA-binding NarL/FixJ family response regulator
VSVRHGARARLVAIDDDAILAELVQTLLAEEGFDVAVCRNWREAHDFIIHQQPDLVLLDLRFGDAEYGWRVLDHLTVDPATRRIPVILWSGAHESLQAHRPALLPQHGVFVLSKPFDIEALISAVNEALAAYPPLLRLNNRQPPQSTSAQNGAERLTAREQEVARLVRRGYTNRQIADELVLTVGSVANHVAHILRKLECSSRVQVAIRTTSGGGPRWPQADDRHTPDSLLG